MDVSYLYCYCNINRQELINCSYIRAFSQEWVIWLSAAWIQAFYVSPIALEHHYIVLHLLCLLLLLFQPQSAFVG